MTSGNYVKRPRRPWTAEDYRVLDQMLKNGFKWPAIAKELGRGAGAVETMGRRRRREQGGK